MTKWTPPPEADRLTENQRAAVDEIIRAMLENTPDGWPEENESDDRG